MLNHTRILCSSEKVFTDHKSIITFFDKETLVILSSQNIPSLQPVKQVYSSLSHFEVNSDKSSIMLYN